MMKYLAVVVAMIAALLVSGCAHESRQTGTSSGAPPSATSGTVGRATPTPPPSLESLVPTLKASVVFISYTIVEDDPLFDDTVSIGGSGVIVAESEGLVYVATNRHVVDWGYLGWSHYDTDVPGEVGGPEIVSETRKVTTLGGHTYAAVLARAAPSSDLAVLAFRPSARDYTIARMNLQTPKVGEEVVVIGNPSGGGHFSVAKGIVSNVVRSEGVVKIQTDAAINPGNSGGGLFNRQGELIGLNTEKISKTGVEGLGFAIHIKEFSDMSGIR